MGRFLLVLAVVASAASPTVAEEKSETLALWSSIVTTSVGYAGMVATFNSIDDDGSTGQRALFVTSATLGMIGPSIGHVYAGEYKHAIETSILRVGGAAAVIGGAVIVSRHSGHCDLNCGTGGGILLFGLGASAIIGTTIYDVVDSRRAVRRYNARASVVPVVSQGMIGGALVGSF